MMTSVVQVRVVQVLTAQVRAVRASQAVSVASQVVSAASRVVLAAGAGMTGPAPAAANAAPSAMRARRVAATGRASGPPGSMRHQAAGTGLRDFAMLRKASAARARASMPTDRPARVSTARLATARDRIVPEMIGPEVIVPEVISPEVIVMARAETIVQIARGMIVSGPSGRPRAHPLAPNVARPCPVAATRSGWPRRRRMAARCALPS